jgi:putative flavoprotein involved in K+ transport
MREQHDTVIVGGGQAGLAMSAVLQRHGREHVVLERARVGERWRSERWDSLRFQFPNWSLRLPGYGYAGDDPDGFASYFEVLAVIEGFAARVRAPVREHTEVVDLVEDDTGGGFVLSLADGAIHAQRVVLATGPFQRPRIPEVAQQISAAVLHTDPTRYRRPEQLPAGAVLVVGSGASGCQIADELVHAGRRVYLSVSRHRRVPRRLWGKDLYWWLDKMGRFSQTIDSFPGRRWPPSMVVTGVNGGYDVSVRDLIADGVTVLGRIQGGDDEQLRVARDANRVLEEADDAYADFLDAAGKYSRTAADEDLAEEQPTVAAPLPTAAVTEIDTLDLTRARITTIIWATGYTYDYDWVKIPVFDERGHPVQQRGLTHRPGLYFLGLHWMHTFKSGLLCGVGDDAEYLAEQMARPR